MHKESHAEHSISEEIHVLLGFNLIRSGGEQLLGIFMEIMGGHGTHIGIAKVTEAMCRGTLYELMEITGAVIFLEMIVEKIVVGLLA